MTICVNNNSKTDLNTAIIKIIHKIQFDLNNNNIYLGKNKL